jgi:aspartyl-tRNA(Asn)/glutamyl-tRNA(Gln) amidotransferase subunit A
VRELAAQIASGSLGPDRLLDGVLERVGRLEPKVQAWSYLDAEAARFEAEVLTAESRRGQLRGPLHGIPFGVKDEFHVRGMPTGMRNVETPVPEPEDATVVARLRAAGAIVLGKTHMPVGRRIPPTANPWNQEHTAGGTSSGSGAAVGARMVSFAIGEQTMGSNLRPAAYCGVVGLKPTYGRISRFGCFPFAWSLDHVGLIGLSVADLALVLSVVAGADERDPSALSDPPPAAELAIASMAPPRIGVVRNFFLEGCDACVLDAIDNATRALRDAGAKVEDILLPEDFALTWTADRVVSAAEGATFHAPAHENEAYSDRDFSGSAGRAGALIPAPYYLQARRIRRWLLQRLQVEAFSEVDALLMPTVPGPAPRRPSTGNAQLLVPWSFLGLPALTLPYQFSPDGLPLALQFVAGHKNDYELLRAGAWCEAVLGSFPAPDL